MLGTPIFDQLRADMPGAPICSICRSVIFTPHGECAQCFMLNRDQSDQYANWHCADCGEFIDGLERHQIVTEHKVSGGYRADYVFLCREHYDARMATPQKAGR
jgi:hypothetical protein